MRGFYKKGKIYFIAGLLTITALFLPGSKSAGLTPAGDTGSPVLVMHRPQYWCGWRTGREASYVSVLSKATYSEFLGRPDSASPVRPDSSIVSDRVVRGFSCGFQAGVRVKKVFVRFVAFFDKYPPLCRLSV